MKKAIVFIALSIIGVMLYTVAHVYATIDRGYIAYGGEVLLLTLPFQFFLLMKVRKDIMRGVKTMSIVAVQFQNKSKPEEFSGREYTYFSDVKLEVGEVILAPTKTGMSVVRVCRTDMTDSDIDERVMPFMRTIESKLTPDDLEV